jgi:hypothetical protein
MRTIVVSIFILTFCLGLSSTAMARSNPEDFGPAKITLTVPQEKLLFESVMAGLDNLVLPLTIDQQENLEQSWPGWHGIVLTIYPSDMIDSDGSIYVIPN